MHKKVIYPEGGNKGEAKGRKRESTKGILMRIRPLTIRTGKWGVDEQSQRAAMLGATNGDTIT